MVKIAGALGVTSLQRWGCGRDPGALWGGGCPLCCAHTPPPSLHPESWLGLADWVVKTRPKGGFCLQGVCHPDEEATAPTWG